MKEQQMEYEEKTLRGAPGMLMLFVGILLVFAAIAAIIFGFLSYVETMRAGGVVLAVIGIVYLCFPAWLFFAGLKVIKPGEALVLTLFGKYVGTLKKDGFFFVNPFCTAVNPTVEAAPGSLSAATTELVTTGKQPKISTGKSKKISLKTMTLDNEKQKINDLLGNPIIIGIAVTWRVENTAKAVFGVDNYREYLSIQCDSALRDTVRLYPYDISEDGEEKSLRGSSQEIAENLKGEIQRRVACAGLEIQEARITHLAYAPEIAAAMLQRQQATAVIDARKMIVDGAVGMVEMALEKLSQKQIVELDEERKAQMVSNLMVVLCGNKDAQPIVNSGSIY